MQQRARVELHEIADVIRSKDRIDAAACLAGEAGLRSSEVKALGWREDVDLIAKTIIVKQQTCYGETRRPKGRTRRTIPMTSTLEQALRRLEVIREGSVVRNLDGSATESVLRRVRDAEGREVDASFRLERVGESSTTLVEKKLSEKRINNILAVLSKPMKYAVDCELIAKSPKIGLYEVERPEI